MNNVVKLITLVKDLLIEQGVKSVRSGLCVYNQEVGGKTLKCAVGHIIDLDVLTEHGAYPQNIVAEEFSDELIQHVIDKYELELDVESTRILLSEIQSIHDTSDNNSIERFISCITSNYNLLIKEYASISNSQNLDLPLG